MELINKYWIDKNNNRWNAEIYSKEESENHSKTLNHCKNCTNCTNCLNCTDCIRCIRCVSCKHCIECINCNNLTNCKYAKICTDCESCVYCAHCRHCTNCTDCENCTNCTDCRGCTDCKYSERCVGCAECESCTNCTNCIELNSDPQQYKTKNIGSRNSKTTFFKNDQGVFVSCGCFWGTLKEFEKAVIETHCNNKHAKNYFKEIEKVKILFEVKGE